MDPLQIPTFVNVAPPSPPAHNLEKIEEALVDILPPACLLPSEVLQKIFTLFVEDIMSPTFEQLATGDFVDSRDLHSGPWLLSRISSRWRSIAFAMPHLWTRMNVNLDREKSARQTLFDVYKKSLTTLNDSRYHINLYSQRSDIEYDEIYSPLSTSCYHWQSLGLSLPGAAFYSLGHNGPLDIYASLEDVRLHIQSPMPEELPMIPPTGRCPILEQAPRLRSLVVNNVVAFKHIFRVPWNHIIRFELTGSVEKAFRNHFSGAYITALHELLGKFVHLEYASLCPHGDHPLSVQPLVQDYENTSLRCVTFGRFTAGIRDELLLHTDLPSLEVLHLNDSPSTTDFPKPLGGHTGNSIRELSIFVSEEEISSLIAFLRSTPNLRTLEIRTMASLDVGTSVLAAKDLVPHLNLLRIRGAKTISVVEVMRAEEPPSVGLLRL